MTPSPYIELKSIKGIGPKRYEKTVDLLQQKQMSLGDLYRLSGEEIKAHFGLPINVAERVATHSDSQSSEQHTVEKNENVSLLTKPTQRPEPDISQEIRKLTHQNSDYPAKLQKVLGDKAPKTLHVWGNLDLLNRPAFGFCGSRSVTQKGLNVTADAAEQIADRDWVVISGHARGVDTTAHRVALENDAGTIIVIPQGIDTFKLRRELKAIAKPENLLIISEFEPDAGWAIGRAMQRNRTILGLSDVMILIESRLKGGTFNAGKDALRLKRPLYVANFSETVEANAGNQYFIERGAIKLGKSPTTQRANLKEMFNRVESNHSHTSGNDAKNLPLPVERKLPL